MLHHGRMASMGLPGAGQPGQGALGPQQAAHIHPHPPWALLSSALVVLQGARGNDYPMPGPD